MTLSPEELPNRFDHAEACPRIARRWEELGCFHADPDPSRTPFTIVIPPPNVTGALHLGHALNNTLQDIMIRWKRMQGFNTLWMPGTDHAGIATQAVVERRLKEEEGKTRHDLGRAKLVERIWQWKDQYEARILSQLKQMGCSCDWRRTRFTLDAVCARAVRRTFFDLFRESLIYRGLRLVNWDTFLQTTVSDDEVFHETVKGNFWHFRYPVIDAQPGEPDCVTIATTRPETMLGDTAVAVHPDPAAALDAWERELRSRLEKAAAKEKPDLERELQQLEERRRIILPGLIRLRNMAIAGRKLRLPLVNREIPLVADEWAKPEMGSGCVKITPAHDPNDYEVGRRQSLPMINILNPEGTLNANAGPYQGLKIRAARERVVADMEAAGLLEQTEDREIDLAHSDRSKTPIEPYIADQWFVKMDRLAQSAMDAVRDGRVTIIPSRYAKSYLDWLGEKRDWPVSRQLWWGHQIPVWSRAFATREETRRYIEKLDADPRINEQRAAYYVEEEAIRAAESRFMNADGNSAGKADTFATIHVCIADENSPLESILESDGFAREQDVLDTWFSSALWPHSTLGWPEKTAELACFYPTSVLITSRDIITLWVARMVLTGLHNLGDVPFRQVYIHPKILDRDGETMSKSKGNGVDPLDVIGKFGPDALRYGLAYLCTETQDVRMPVQFECPHCQSLVDQTRANRELPRIRCGKCSKEFSTQWARSVDDNALPRGLVVSERFEVSRNFCNKLWNAARFALINLREFQPGSVEPAELTVEDRWVLSRLATVSRQATEALESYRFGEAARVLYDFTWDEFCSFYLEMAKGRLQAADGRTSAQRVLAHVLDHLLRLLHPIIPFVTEEIWQLLNAQLPVRGLGNREPAAESIMRAQWPAFEAGWIDAEMEQRFARFQAMLGALRDIRSRQNIAPRKAINFCVRTTAETAELLRPMAVYFQSMANASLLQIGATIDIPKTHAMLSLEGAEVFVDLSGLIDLDAEIARLEKEERKFSELLQAIDRKLAAPGFSERAPAPVVAAEREKQSKYNDQLQATRAALGELRNSK
jgi:valyl-tRNA synthetase